MVSVTLALVTVAIAGTAKVTQVVMERLDLDATTVLLWLGLAEWDSRPRVQRRVEGRIRQLSRRRLRRSPHRRLERPSARRRPYSV